MELIKLACLALMITGSMIGAGIAPHPVCTASDVCSYSITGQGFDPTTGQEIGGNTFNISFSTLGPEEYNAPANFLLSFSVAGTPAPGWALDTSNYGLTSYGSDGSVFATFVDDSQDGSSLSPVTYEFFGTDAFWATPGNAIGFGATNDSTATSGAFFDVNTSGPQSPPAFNAALPSDPPCTGCTVTITATPTVPEPGSMALIAAAGVVFLLFRRKPRLD